MHDICTYYIHGNVEYTHKKTQPLSSMPFWSTGRKGDFSLYLFIPILITYYIQSFKH